MECCVDWVGCAVDGRGDRHHQSHRHGASGWNDELRCPGRMAGRASVDRRNCGRIYFALASQATALSEIVAAPPNLQLTDSASIEAGNALNAPAPIAANRSYSQSVI